MSLKAFHLLFIAVSAALCLWVVGWGFAHSGEALGAALAAVGAAGFIGLVAYFRAFRRREAAGAVGPKLIVPLLLAAASRSAEACTTCMGVADPKTAQALQWGIVFLAVIALGTVSSIAVMMYRAIRAQEAAKAAESPL